MRQQRYSEDDLDRMVEMVRGSTDARRTTDNGSSCEAANHQTKRRRGESPPSPFILSLTGQLPSGKTSGVKEGYRKNGSKYRYPNKRFINWRADALIQLLEQNRPEMPIDSPSHLVCDYWPGDLRTRDVPGMEDALLHLLVKARILKDDGLIWDMTWRRHELNRKFPKVVMEVRAYA